MPESELFETTVDFDEYHRLREIERCAAGLIATTDPPLEAGLAAFWWRALVEALKDAVSD